MGSYGKGGTGSIGFAETINGGKIVVPKRVWKVAVILPIGNNDLARVTSDTRFLPLIPLMKIILVVIGNLL